MAGKRWLVRVVVCAVLCALLVLVAGEAAAQDRSTSDLDKGLSQKRGVSDSLASGKIGPDESKGPNKLQVFLGVGSIFVMIAVVKWI